MKATEFLRLIPAIVSTLRPPDWYTKKIIYRSNFVIRLNTVKVSNYAVLGITITSERMEDAMRKKSMATVCAAATVNMGAAIRRSIEQIPGLPYVA